MADSIEGGHVISGSDGLGAHGAGLAIDGVFALDALICLEHGEDLKAHLVIVVAPLALLDPANLVYANDVGQVRGQGVQKGGGQQVVAPVVCSPFEFGVERDELLHHGSRSSLGAGSHALLNQGLALVGSLGDARIVVLDL
eukprot:6185216-Pleurochrysis_carterae.AAC.1